MGLGNKLKFIKTYDSLSEIKTALDNELNDEVIIIDYSQVDPKLRYCKRDNRGGSWTILDIDGSDSPKAPATMSDLEYFLRKRDWNITERVFVLTPTTENLEQSTSDNSADGELYIYSGGLNALENTLSVIPTKIEGDIGTVSSKYLKISEEYDEASELAFLKLYDELLINKQMKTLTYFNNIFEEIETQSVNLGTYYYYNLISTRDFEKDASIIDLISLSGSKYTSVLNLNGLLKANPDFMDLEKYRSKIVVGVQYTENNKMYSKEIDFPIFTEILTGGTYLGEEYLTKVSESVTAELRDGCIRVFPESNKVTECIIGYCYLIYDGIY